MISVKYSLSYENPISKILDEDKKDFPLKTYGESSQLIWWDNEKGRIDHYSEDFKIVIETSLGNKFDFTGKTYGEYSDFDDED